MTNITRRQSTAVKVGKITIGGDFPIVVQSMTNTDTADVDRTVEQIGALAKAGSEIVRITLNNKDAAQAVPILRERLLRAARALSSSIRSSSKPRMLMSAMVFDRPAR